MHRLAVILALGAGIALVGGVQAQIPGASALAGTVTLVDTNREWIVLQEKGQAKAVKLGSPFPALRVGERVIIEGAGSAYFAAFPDFPDHPSGREVLSRFQSPTDWNNHFLGRIRGILRAPADGNYTFWLAAADEAELLLGANAGEASAKPIALVENDTQPGEWDREAGQKSKPVFLKAGESYYIEARHREWRGHDHLAVAWQGPGFGRCLIEGEFLSPWPVQPAATNGVLKEYWTNCFLTRLAILSSDLQDATVVKIREAKVTSMGPGELPPPRRLQVGQAWSDDRSYLYVEVEGTVGFAAVDNGQLVLELTGMNNRKENPGSRMEVRVLDWGNQPVLPLHHRNVRVRGVCERVLNEKGEPTGILLWAQDAGQITVLDNSDHDAQGLEVLPMFELTPTNLNLAWGRKILVRGTVMDYDPKSGAVKLRGEDSFYAYTSRDGATWSPIGEPLPVAMGEVIYAGLAASSMTSTGRTEAVFDKVNADFDPVDIAGLGKISTSAGVAFTNGCILLRPAGGNDWDARDEGLFLYRQLKAEGEIVAQLRSFQSTRISDKAGLMMRESLSADSPYVALVMTHGTRLDLLYRSARRTFAKAVDQGSSELPQWLRLTRRQHTLTAQLASGTRLRVRQQVELIGLLHWQNGEPLLTGAFVRLLPRPEHIVPAAGGTRESRIADLPSAASESEQFLGESYLIQGVVTFMGRAFGREWLFLQDESGAASIRASQAFFRSRKVEPGQLLEAKGNVQFSAGIAPFRLNTSTVLGWSQMPRPWPFPDRADAKLAEGRWVEANGIVRSVTNNVMRIMERNGPVSVWVGGLAISNSLARYVDCRVKVRGVFSTQVMPAPVLLVPLPRFLEVTEWPPDDPFVIPSFAIGQVGLPDEDASLLHRTKVVGIVTYRDEENLVVQDQSGGARVPVVAAADVRVGDRVAVVGFPELEAGAVTLRQPVVRKVGEGQLPVPIEMTMEGLIDSRLNGWLVRMEGVLLDQKTREGKQLLELQSGQRVFQALLPESAGRLKPLPIGSRVEVTGVTQLQITSQVPEMAGRRDVPRVATMDILMRTPTDLVLLERPPWWTWRHTVSVGALLVVFLVGAFGWIRALRRRVAQRTGELQDAMGRLQKETELSATLAERERLAAEIHDTLEQGLSGIMMQLDGVDSRLTKDTEGARQNLEMARRMVRFSRAEVRHSLWNLESQLLKDGDLGAAIKEIARQMSTGCSTAVACDVSEGRVTLPAAVEHHLLRCVQETISNALKHSGATDIRVTLSYSSDNVELLVADNGCGFDPDQALTSAGSHLGLRNLRSRARKMKGRIEITCAPQKGTTVRLTVPLTDRAEKTPAPEL